MCKTMTERQIAESMGVGYSTWIRYKSEFRELREVLKKGRLKLVNDLRSTLIRKAEGFEYTEKEVLTDFDGRKRVREITKYALPDVAALNLLLKNYDRENWSNDPQMLEIRKEELELRKKQIENNEWI